MKPLDTLTPELADEYRSLWASCVIRTEKARQVKREALLAASGEQRYRDAGGAVGAPWVFVGCVHMLEGGCNFNTHLHNGDPLKARTVHVPKGRPPLPLVPPFTWEQSAADALALKSLGQWRNWTIAGLLYQLERYNGWGHRLYHASVKSPYLWAGSNHYTKGKYVSDGKWSATAVSAQIGAAVLLRELESRGFWKAVIG